MAEIETEREMSRSDVAEYLRTFADELDASGTASTNETASNEATTDDAASSEDTSAEESDDRGTTTDDTRESTTDDDYETDVERRNRANSDDSERSDRSDGRVTFMVGNESTTINPPETVTFEVSVDSDSSLIGTGTGRTARFAIHWDESDVPDDDELSIQ